MTGHKKALIFIKAVNHYNKNGMELYIIRHGETVWNSKGLLQGNKDIELNENGIAAAKAFGKEIKNLYFDRVYSSPLNRAYTTAKLITQGKNIPIIKDERLRELSFGDCEGTDFRIWKEASCPYHWFFDNPAKYTPPVAGESLHHLCARTQDFISSEIEKNCRNLERVMIVAHGALNASITTFLEKRSMENFWGQGLQKNCQASVYLYDGQWHKKS